ncbi:putative protein K02A2.6-like protein, partial [Paramuricea clavata]
MEEVHNKLAGGKTFTELDLSHAYEQMVLDDASKDVVTINTHRGLYRYNRLPYGVSSAPGIFQRTMESLLNGIPYTGILLDNILISGPTDEEHLQNLEEVMKRLSEAGLRLKKSKCRFMQPTLECLGYRIDETGIYPVEAKVKAVQEAPTPTNVTELKAYLGLLNFYGKFLPNLSTELEPLYQLLRKNQRWKWNTEQIRAFERPKTLLQSATVLVHYDPNKKLTVSCDASPYGVGAVLSHEMPDGSERPIAFASRTLTSAEKKYSQLDKEGLAMVFAVKKFHQFLYGRHYTIYTDHKPLLGIFKSAYDQRFREQGIRGIHEKNGIRHVKSAPYHPSTNGLVERAVQTFKKAMKKQSGTLQTRLSRFLFKYRTTPHTTTGISPAELRWGTKLRSHLTLLQPDVGKTVRYAQHKQKRHCDEHVRQRSVSIGDDVFVRNYSNPKFPWTAGKVVESTGPISAKVALDDGKMRKLKLFIDTFLRN